jgi:hypothetical protein
MSRAHQQVKNIQSIASILFQSIVTLSVSLPAKRVIFAAACFLLYEFFRSALGKNRHIVIAVFEPGLWHFQTRGTRHGPTIS